MAENTGTLLDEDRDSPDWIELLNPGPATVLLAGWFLTDDPGKPAKWKLPATNLVANARLVVFASGKDRSGPGPGWHTNFKLASAGGYLALVRPDGLTVEHAVTYPAQHPDISYGVSRAFDALPLAGAGDRLRVLVPANNALGMTWTGGTEPFADQDWLTATNAVGYDEAPKGPAGLLGWWNFDETGNTTVALDASGRNNDAQVRGGAVLTVDGGGRSGRPGDRALKFSGAGYAVVPQAATGLFDSSTAHDAITVSLWINGDPTMPQDNAIFYGSVGAGGTGARGIEVHLPWTDRRIYWDTAGCCDASSQRVSIDAPDTTQWQGRWNHYVFLKNGAVKEIWRNGQRILQGTSTAKLTTIRGFYIGAAGTGNQWVYHGLVDDFAVWDQALTPEQIQALAAGVTPLGLDSLRPLINTDLASAMRGRAASAYLRFPFVFSPTNDVELLLLKIKYNDGFVGWLNGVEVARRNAPTTLAFDSAALEPRSKESARQAEEIDLSAFLAQLHPGTNVLAIRGLKTGADDGDFLVAPELVTGRSLANRFFLTPTPGAPNKTGVAGFVSDPRFDPPHGFHFAPFEARIVTDTPGATLVYTVDGTAPSLTNGKSVTGGSVTLRVATTTALRAVAFKTGLEPSAITTASHLFPTDIPKQSRPANLPATWPGGFPANFAVDARVITNALPGHGWTNGLLDIPSLSIVMPPTDLWDAAKGIYANPMVDGDRAASIEMLFPGGNSPGWQMNGGAGIRGLSSEYKSLTPKHSFTLAFRKRYGGSKLDFPVFGDGAAQQFKAMVLRGNELDSWANSEKDWNHVIDGELRWYRTRASYVRDQWMRDTQLAMGRPAGHGRFVHLFLNGFYWGLYNLTERLDSHFSADYLGGHATDYDVVADSNAKDGNLNAWSQLMSLANAGLASNANYQKLMGNDADGRRNPKLPVLLDVTNLVDYMVLHIYAGADDWPWHNWIAIRDRSPASTGFKFLAWDQEISINSLVKQHTDLGQLYAEVNAGATSIYALCRANAEFRQLFADRIQSLMFNGGPLAVSNNIARYNTRVAEIDRAVVPESARWGAFYRPAKPYLREVEWLGTNQWMRQVFFPSNHFVALKRFRAAGLFPALDAPAFSQFGGPVPAGFKLVMTNPSAAGTIYFTTDGTDPRQTGGGVNPAAQVYSGPVDIPARTLARARVRSGSTWSALVEAVFEPPQDFTALQITEIMYHPPESGTESGDSFEFLELQNTGTATLALSGLVLTNGINFAFTNGTLLAPGQFLVLVRDPVAFAAKYPGVSVNGVYTGKLDNAGETITLARVGGDFIWSLIYNDKAPWPASADGSGDSLQRSNTTATGNDPANWRAAPPSPGRPYVADSDGDGLPDWWEVVYGFDPFNLDQGADPDHDGMSNAQEFRAGTNPQDATSVFRLAPASVDAQGRILLRWTMAAQGECTVYVATDLAPPVVWRAVTNVMAGNEGVFSVALPAQTARQFFRLSLP